MTCITFNSLTDVLQGFRLETFFSLFLDGTSLVLGKNHKVSTAKPLSDLDGEELCPDCEGGL